jgi:hypothetical protein
MRTFLLLGLASAVALAFSGAAPAEDVTPFPAAHSGDVFVIAQTVGDNGALGNYYAPGSTITFRAYAVDGKTRQIVMPKLKRYFYATIPNQPNVKLAYTPTSRLASGRFAWTGTWTVPANYPLGTVAFKVNVQTTTKHRGSYVQVPVASAALTIANNPQTGPGAGPAPAPSPNANKLDVVLYADTVNGSRPTGAVPRPIGCTQTNVYKRGEQVVVRSWGFDLGSGTVLTMDNVAKAQFSIAGQPDVPLNWSSHGPTGAKVWFWANAWNIPATYPLGTTTLHVVFTLTSGKTGTIDHPIMIVP